MLKLSSQDVVKDYIKSFLNINKNTTSKALFVKSQYYRYLTNLQFPGLEADNSRHSISRINFDFPWELELSSVTCNLMGEWPSG